MGPNKAAPLQPVNFLFWRTQLSLRQAGTPGLSRAAELRPMGLGPTLRAIRGNALPGSVIVLKFVHAVSILGHPDGPIQSVISS